MAIGFSSSVSGLTFDSMSQLQVVNSGNKQERVKLPGCMGWRNALCWAKP
jgi:hypothetical protein